MDSDKHQHPIEDIHLRSEEVQEILGRPPRLIVRVGITVILLVVAGLFVGSYFIKYPDIVSATITVNTENLPADVMAKSSGRIDSLYVSEKQHVEAGDILAVLENTADVKDVMWVKTMLREGDSTTVETRYATPLQSVRPLQLGDIQSAYTAFTKAQEDYDYFVSADYHNKKIAVINRQIAAQKNILQKSSAQLNVSREQLASAKRIFSMDSSLFAKGMISVAEYESAKNAYLQQLQSYESARLGIDNQQMGILQSEQSVFDLEQQRTETENGLQVALAGAAENLRTQIAAWEKNYLVTAPCSGVVTMTKYWQKNQNVGAGEVLLTVVPEGDVRIIGKILLPLQGAGKVKEGQTVNVKFDNYPYMEYGMVKVEIRNISLVPIEVKEGEKAYMLEVEFPEKLTTTYGKELKFSQDMAGTAEIITEDLRLLDKFINPIKAVVKR